MAAHPLAGVPLSVWRRAAAAERPLLLLDYDGTLAPFRVERFEARPPSRTVERLRRIAAAGRTAVAIVSGRPIEELGRLLAPLTLHLVGEHGWEERFPDGTPLVHPVPAPAAAGLAQAAADAAARGLSARLERKRASVVLHVRGLSPEVAAASLRAARAMWRPRLVAAGLHLTRTNGGIELRASGRDKGAAVQDLVRRRGAGAFAVYVGDDRTDEDAFDALGPSGVGIRVGRDRRVTAAIGRLDSPEDLPWFLAAWSHLVDGISAEGEERS
jgi:trehalose 6-phosphate phosphatase